MNKEMYKSTYGLWEVKTEGDCEGRSTKNLGTHKGYVDEIALHLANQSYYVLNFKLIHKIEKFEPSKKEVHVSFDISSGTWDMDKQKRINIMKVFFADRPVHIEESNYYASFKITTEKNVRAEDTRKALDKLTDYEKELLGLG